jgi:hypothetical protein
VHQRRQPSSRDGTGRRDVPFQWMTPHHPTRQSGPCRAVERASLKGEETRREHAPPDLPDTLVHSRLAPQDLPPLPTRGAEDRFCADGPAQRGGSSDATTSRLRHPPPGRGAGHPRNPAPTRPSRAPAPDGQFRDDAAILLCGLPARHLHERAGHACSRRGQSSTRGGSHRAPYR